jgi:hypothetical protein
MDRRTFFKNLLGGSAAVAIAPAMFAEIVSNNYGTTPETFFSKNTGFFLFHENKLIAWSPEEMTALSFNKPMVEISSLDVPYITYWPGMPEGRWEVSDLQAKVSLEEYMDKCLQVIFKKNGNTITSDVYITSLAFHDDLLPTAYTSAALQISGECTIQKF